LLLGITAAFIVSHAIFAGLQYTRGYDYVFGLSPLLRLNTRHSLSAWYSSLALALCALLLYAVYDQKAKEQDRFRRHWFVLSLVFLFLSVDEYCGIHEAISRFIRRFETLGLAFGQWAIVYALLLLVFVVAYLPFLQHLGARFRALFIASGAVYVGGAMGVELATASYVTRTRENAEAASAPDAVYGVLTAVEDSVEMLGILLFIVTLLAYMRTHKIRFTLDVGP
jgi:hypothetical protein